MSSPLDTASPDTASVDAASAETASVDTASADAIAALSRMVFRPWDSQIIATAVRFELAERLSAGPRTGAGLAADLGADPDTFDRFLSACAVLGVVERDSSGRYALTAAGRYLESNPVFRNMLMMNAGHGMWSRMSRLHETVLTGRPVVDDAGEDLYGYYAHNPRERAWHAGAMAGLSVDAGENIATHVDLTPYSTIVDIGGSLGVLLSRLLKAAPHAKGTLFDLPGIVERARAKTFDADVAERLSFVEGSFFTDPPPPADLYIIKQVLCDWGDEDAARILTNVFRSAPPGSRLVVVEWVRPGGPEPSNLDLMSLCLQVVTGGRARTEADFVRLLEGVGYRYESCDTVPSTVSPRPWNLLRATRP